MEENTQVLDVTYGNFSCRLEGFEDSVETMKLVVSFFHELAGHDRFMDTEPLAPDMTTLARLNGPDGSPGSSLAVGFLVPMLGFGLNGWWASFHGDFATRTDVRTSEKEIGQNADHG